MSYKRILGFGNSPNNSLPVFANDPITVCVGSEPMQRFNRGGDTSAYGQNSPECQILLAQRCSKMWDGACETASRQNGTLYSKNVPIYNDGSFAVGMDSGDLMIRNTAMEKYRVDMRTNPYGSHDCKLITQQFSSLNPASPFITRYVGDCIGSYAVNPDTIDYDPVMNKILDNPYMYMPLLKNIESTMTRNGTIHSLYGTKLGNFFAFSKSNVNL